MMRAALENEKLKAMLAACGEHITALEAERDRLRAVALAMAEACDKCATRDGLDLVSKGIALTDMVEQVGAVLGIGHPDQWSATRDALRALAVGGE